MTQPWRAIVAASMTAGVALRCGRLLSRPLWLDELITWTSASGVGWAGDLHPPTFAILVGALAPLGAPLALRGPSFVAGLVSVGLAWRAGLAWSGPRSAAVCATWCAVSAPWVAYSHEGRAYAVAGMGSWLLLAAIGGRSGRLTALAAATASVWTWTGAAVSLILLLAASLEPSRRNSARWGLAGWAVVTVPMALAFLPAQMLSLSASPASSSPAWQALAPPLELLGWPIWGSGPHRAVVGAFLGLLLLGARHRATPLPLMCVSSIAAFWLAHALGWHPLGGTRQCLVLTPSLMLWAGACSEGMGAKAWAAALGTLAIVCSAVSLGAPPGVPVVDVPALVSALPDDDIPVWVDPRIAPAWAYYGGRVDIVSSWRSPTAPPDRPIWLIVPAKGAPEGAQTLSRDGVRAVLAD